MRLNTQRESIGAEFLVLGNLLIEGISAYKAYQNFKGYDIVAVNEEKNKSARIQVKSRYQTGWTGFIINNFDSDFVILVALNRGYKKPKNNGDLGKRLPDCYIFPTLFIKSLENTRGKMGKLPKSSLSDLEMHKNAWHLIDQFLKS